MKKKLLKSNGLKLLLLCFVLLNKGSFAQFVTVWKTNNVGVSASNQITIPTNTSYTYSYTVNWGDASSNTYVVNTPPTHTYATPGTYTVSITGNFPSIRFTGGGDRLKLLSIDNWGTGTWQSFDGAFWGCSNVVGTFTAAPILGPAINLSAMFKECSVFNTDISNWNVGAVTNMYSMFCYATAFNQPIGAWNVAAVTNMSQMFYNASAFNQPIGAWNVGAVTDMTYMFYNASAFNQAIGTWNVGAVTNMSQMFQNATAFNQPLGTWNVGAVTDMNNMFKQAIAFNQTIGAWNVGAVTDMSSMFNGASAFNQAIGTWNVGAVTNMSSMFNSASAFNQPIGTWNVGAVTNMTNMFNGVTLSIANYHNLLIGWDALVLQPSVNFHGGNSKYCSAAAIAAHNNMTSIDLWVITDGGISANPTISVNSGSICAGQSFTMVPSGALTYTYSNGSAIATPTAYSTYSVSGTDAIGCVSSVSAVSYIAVYTLPTVLATTNNTLLCSGQTVSLTATGASSYTWNTTATTPVIAVSPTVTETYTVTGTDANGCINMTTVMQNVSLCTGVYSQLAIQNSPFVIYPNPNNGLFILELTTNANVTITNALGQIVISEMLETGKHPIDISNESSGVYFVKVIENNQQHIQKVIKQ